MMLCCVDGCGKARYQRSRYCVTHKMGLWRNGDLESRSRKGRVYPDAEGYLREGATRQHRTVLLAAIGAGSHPCHWCGGLVSWDRTYPRDRDGLVVDHLDGIKTHNDPANLVPAHNACNARRGMFGNAWAAKRNRERSVRVMTP